MQKQYSKKQIQNTIAYWQKYLQRLDESKSQLLNAFVKKFGEDLVFNTEMTLSLTQDNAQIIFQILDQSFFNNKLSKINNLKLFAGNAARLNPIIRAEYAHNANFDISDYFALFQPDIKYITSPNGYLKMITKKYGIFINIDQKINLPYAIVTICHEMIHCLDFTTGQLLMQTEQMINKKYPMDVIDYASHFTNLFKQKRNLMKTQNNLTIPITGDGKTIEQICAELASEANIMKENDVSSEFLPEFVASPEFQKLYKNDMTFDENGHIKSSMLFGHLNKIDRR